MAEYKQTDVDIQNITLALEQKFASTTALTGVAPSLVAEPFVPYSSDVDGIWRYKQHDDDTKDEADTGGLFTLNHKQPGILEQVLADFSSAVAWTASIVTSAGEWEISSGTGQHVVLIPRSIIMPGENIKITCAAPTGEPWVRIYLRSDQMRK